jgi:hypothetical protein
LFSAARKSFISALREGICEDLRWMELAKDREKKTRYIISGIEDINLDGQSDMIKDFMNGIKNHKN